MQKDVVTVVIEVRAQPGLGELLRAELSALARVVVAQEPDCLGIEMLQGEDDDTRVLLYERWTSRAAYTGPHTRTPHMLAFMQKAPAFAAGAPTITFWRTTENLSSQR